MGNGVSAIVLAAGEGTRMRSAAPKVLHKLAGRTLVEHAVRAAAGVTIAIMVRMRSVSRSHMRVRAKA